MGGGILAHLDKFVGLIYEAMEPLRKRKKELNPVKKKAALGMLRITS